MELTHSFTVPTSVDDAWALFMDLERVGGCFPGATVTEVTDDDFSGTVKVKLGPIALVYAGSGSFVERDDAAHHAVIEAKGKDKRGNGTAGATVTIRASTGDRRRHPGRRRHRPRRHRQAGAVRPRRHAGRVRQAAPGVRRLHREAADGTCRSAGAGGPGGRGPGRRGGHDRRDRLDRLRRDGLRRARRRHGRAEARGPGGPGCAGGARRTSPIRRAGSRPTSRRTRRSTSARPSCRCSSSAMPAMRSPPSGSSSACRGGIGS